MRQVITKSLLLLVAVCFLMVFGLVNSKACDPNKLTKCVMGVKKATSNATKKVELNAELTDFIFTQSLLRF